MRSRKPCATRLLFRNQPSPDWEEMLITKIKIGDKMKIPANSKFHPEYGHSGKVVWTSEDGKTVIAQCEKRHNGKEVAVMMRINSSE